MKKIKFGNGIENKILLKIICFIIIIVLIICFIKYILRSNNGNNGNNKIKENFNVKDNSPDNVSESNLINQMFNPYANFIDIGDTSNTYFKGYNAPLDDPKPLNYIGLRLDDTIVIGDITYKQIKPVLERIERKGKEDLDKLLTIGVSPEYFEIKNYVKTMLNQQIADSNASTYLYPLNYSTNQQNIFPVFKSKLPQFDNGNEFILYLFIEYFRLMIKDNYNYISILRYKVLEGKIDRNLNYYYRVQADYFIDTNYTIWALEYEFFMLKVDITLKTLMESDEKLSKNLIKYELSELNTGSYIPIILSCKCVGNYFQDSVFMTTGISPYNYNYGKYKGDTIDDPVEHGFVYETDDLKSKQFVGIDEQFTGSSTVDVPYESPNVGNLDKIFNNLENPRSYSQREYTTQIVNSQNQTPLANQYACFDVNNGNIVFDIYSMKECERNYDDYFRLKPRGVYDKSCIDDADCIFYKQNINYPNERGKCVKGSCELPSGLIPLGYRYYLSQTKPLCYNCYTKDWLPITNLHPCCDEQNDRNKYPFLKSPDYAFKDDLAERTNYYNNKYCNYYPNRKDNPISNTVCKDGRFFYNI